MSRRKIAEHLRGLDETTLKAIERVEAEIAHLHPSSAEVDAAVIVAASNVAIASAVRSLTGYTSDGFDRVVQTIAAAGRTEVDPSVREDRIRLLMAVDGIGRAIGSRPDARARIRAARRGRRIS